jgi:hypothetical protein
VAIGKEANASFITNWDDTAGKVEHPLLFYCREGLSIFWKIGHNLSFYLESSIGDERGTSHGPGYELA